MKIHEYQGKELLRKFGVPVPDGRVAFSVAEAVAVADRLGYPVVIKAQIHAGGRGKGGGVKLAKAKAEAERHAAAILGMQLVTHQTGPEGQLVKKILVEKGCGIERELYLGAVLDRSISRVTLIASAEGGVEIEEVASRHPERIFKIAIDPMTGVDEKEAKKIAQQLGLRDAPSPSPPPTRGGGGQIAPPPLRGGGGGRVSPADQFAEFCSALYEAYLQADCSLAEINPLAVTRTRLLALDAKLNFDDNALFRHPDYAALRDLDEEEPTEIEAKEHDLAYIKLGGTIGCMVNGAGLAMATMDIIKHSGGEPANFLDVGGGATREKVTAAFQIILKDPHVKAILVNIFGGIMRCDVIAEGIVAAAKEVHIQVPVVIRLQGTNVDLGKNILNKSGLSLISEDDLAKAAQKVVMLGSG